MHIVSVSLGERSYDIEIGGSMDQAGSRLQEKEQARAAVARAQTEYDRAAGRGDQPDLVAAGAPEAVERLVEACRLGPPGAEVDFVDNMAGGGFTIRNPNAKTTCGCGQSFTVK